MGRSQFTFYASFASALSRIKKKADRADAYDAICNYALFGAEPDIDKLPDSAAIAFELIRPTLDASRRKAESGKSGGSSKQNGSKTEAKRKLEQTGREKEKENEGEKEKENECYPPTPFSTVMQEYLSKINPTASQASLDELRGYVDQMGPDCCLRAINIALDEKKASWSYIRGILRAKLSAGVKCLADWDELDRKREEAKKRDAGSTPASGSNADGSFHGWRARSAIDDAD